MKIDDAIRRFRRPLRRVQAEDANLACSFILQFVQDTRPQAVTDRLVERIGWRVEQMLTSPYVRGYYLTDASGAIAFIEMRMVPTEIWDEADRLDCVLDLLTVRPDRRNTFAAVQTIASAIAIAREAGAVSVLANRYRDKAPLLERFAEPTLFFRVPLTKDTNTNGIQQL